MIVIIPLLFLFASIYALYDAAVLRATKLRGNSSYAQVVKVEHTIPFGIRKFLSKRDGGIGCDYVVRIAFPTKDGASVSVRTTVHSRMKIVNGKRIPLFVEGDHIPIKYHPRFQKAVYFNMDPIKDRQGTLFPIVVWGCCTVLLLCIVSYMLSV